MNSRSKIIDTGNCYKKNNKNDDETQNKQKVDSVLVQVNSTQSLYIVSDIIETKLPRDEHCDSREKHHG